MLKKFGIVLFAILLVSFVVAPCGAAELVQDGGFENPPGTFNASPWTVTFASSGSFVGVDGNPHTGSYAAYFGATQGLDDTITQQTLPTVPGQSYTFSFWLAHPYTTIANDFHAFWDGGQVLSTNGAANFGYTQFSFNETASGSSAIISFSGYETAAYFFLDDVSVQGPVPTVPEPVSLLFLGAGLVGMTVIKRKNQKEEV